MTTQTVSNFDEFATIAHHVAATDEAVFVTVGNVSKIAIVPMDEYLDTKHKRDRAKAKLFALMEELHHTNAHLDPEAIDDELLKITNEVRYGTSAP